MGVALGVAVTNLDCGFRRLASSAFPPLLFNNYAATRNSNLPAFSFTPPASFSPSTKKGTPPRDLL